MFAPAQLIPLRRTGALPAVTCRVQFYCISYCCHCARAVQLHVISLKSYYSTPLESRRLKETKTVFPLLDGRSLLNLSTHLHHVLFSQRLYGQKCLFDL